MYNTSTKFFCFNKTRWYWQDLELIKNGASNDHDDRALHYSCTQSLKKVGNKVGNTSIVLLPEGCFPKREVVATVSKRRRLFVAFNEDPYHEEGRRYNAMIGMEEGIVVWRVRKHFLWGDEKHSKDSPPEPEPIVNIRGMNTAVAICYELSKVAGRGMLFTIGKIMTEAKTKILLMPAYWQFNWGMPKQVKSICVKKIPSLMACAFASSNIRHREAYAMVYSKHDGYHETRERNGWVGAEI